FQHFVDPGTNKDLNSRASRSPNSGIRCRKYRESRNSRGGRQVADATVVANVEGTTLNYRGQTQEIVDSYPPKQLSNLVVRETRHDFIHRFGVERTFAQEDLLGSVDQLRNEPREIVRMPSLAWAAGSRVNQHDRQAPV